MHFRVPLPRLEAAGKALGTATIPQPPGSGTAPQQATKVTPFGSINGDHNSLWPSRVPNRPSSKGGCPTGESNVALRQVGSEPTLLEPLSCCKVRPKSKTKLKRVTSHESWVKRAWFPSQCSIGEFASSVDTLDNWSAQVDGLGFASFQGCCSSKRVGEKSEPIAQDQGDR